MGSNDIRGADALRWSRQLQRATTLDEPLGCVVGFIRRHTRYHHAWLASYAEDLNTCEIISSIGAASLDRLSNFGMVEMDLTGDAMLREILEATDPVVVIDARTDPRVHPERVAAMGNRTIVNVPIRLDGMQLGALGIGTFGEEGVVAPTREELDRLSMIAGQMSVVISRLRSDQRLVQAEAQLRASQRLDAMGQIAGGVAHDFNNLLMVILGNVDLARSHPLGTAEHCIDDIEAAANRAATLCHQLLSFSRREVHQVQPIELAQVVRGFVPMMERVLPAAVRLEVRGGEHPAVVVADASQLEQVLMNLVINARDAMPEGGLITVEVAEVEHERRPSTPGIAPDLRFAEIVVSDTGTGIDEAILPKLFEPFFSTKGSGGTGLGLSVVHGIVEQHGGTVRAEARPGGGTRFRVVLPMHDAPAVVRVAPPMVLQPEATERVLVVDDNEAVRRVMADLLSLAGYVVETAVDGDDALQALEGRPRSILW